MIEILKSLTSRPFLMFKIEFWANEVVLFGAWITQTTVLKPEETLKLDNFVLVKSAIAHKF